MGDRHAPLLLVLLVPAFAQSPAPALGRVTELADACPAGPLAHTTCRRLQVSCDGLKTIDVQIRITEPAAGAPLRGTLVMGSGGSGNGFYAGAPPVQALVNEIAALGFRVVDRSWTGGWTTSEGGLRKESCRYATLLTWIHGHLHKGGKFVATGNSGGSAEIGYALTTWRRGDILDLAIPTSGPPIARLDYVCVKEPPAEWFKLCPSIVPAGKLECTSTCTLGPSNGVCTQTGLQPTPQQLLDDSVVHPGALLHYPKTKVHFIFGARDCGIPVPAGLTYANQITSDKVIQYVPATPHGIFQTAEGREAVRNAIDREAR